MKLLFHTLSKRECKLSRLNLSQNNIKDTHVQELSQQALSKENCTLIQLNLSENKITDVGVQHLSEALSKTKCALKRLNLSGNRSITHNGVRHLSNKLYKLNQLSLNGIRIGDFAVEHLSRIISKGNCKSIQLDLGSTDITVRSVKGLYKALILHNDKLGLNLHDNKLTDSDVQQLWFAFSMERPNFKLKINLSNNSLTNESVENLNKQLRDKSYTISHLNLSKNKLKDACLETFKKVLPRMPHCQLDLSGNEISEENVHHLTTRRVSYV